LKISDIAFTARVWHTLLQQYDATGVSFDMSTAVSLSKGMCKHNLRDLRTLQLKFVNLQNGLGVKCLEKTNK